MGIFFWRKKEDSHLFSIFPKNGALSKLPRENVLGVPPFPKFYTFKPPLEYISIYIYIIISKVYVSTDVESSAPFTFHLYSFHYRTGLPRPALCRSRSPFAFLAGERTASTAPSLKVNIHNNHKSNTLRTQELLLIFFIRL